MTAATVTAPKPPNNLVGLAVLAAFLGLGALLLVAGGTRSPLTFGFILLGWILAVMAHEFAHAFTAHLGGDTTIRAKGYLAFDPRRYVDVGTSLVIPLIALAMGGIGFPGAAVYLRNDLIRSRAWRAAAALAGPGATLIVLLVLAYGLNLWSRAAFPGPLFQALAMLAFLQATALILNLLPIPGLDGFGAIRPFLPAAWRPAIQKAEGLAMVGLLLLLFVVPGASGRLVGSAASLTAALGVPREAIAAGWDAFHFWR